MSTIKGRLIRPHRRGRFDAIGINGVFRTRRREVSCNHHVSHHDMQLR